MRFKAQSAIEYLMTYGWMLLVVAIAGGTIFSVVGNQSIESVKGLSSGDITVEDYGVSGKDKLQLRLRNTAEDEIEINSVIIEDPETKAFTEMRPSDPIEVGGSKITEISSIKTTSSVSKQNLKINYDQGGLNNLTVEGVITGRLKANIPENCSNISNMSRSGYYKINPGESDNVGPFKVYCEMSENDGGCIKLRVGNDCNNDNMIWYSKYSGVDDQESTHGEIGAQFNWDYLSHLDSQTELVGGSCNSSTTREGFDHVFSDETKTNIKVQWEMWGNSSYTYSEEQMDAIRNQVTKISSTTEAFAHTNDDDGCEQNGEVDLKKSTGGSEYRITHFTSGNQESEYAIETESEMNNYQDVGFLIPSYIDIRNNGTCSGEVDHGSWGFEKNYTLIK